MHIPEYKLKQWRKAALLVQENLKELPKEGRNVDTLLLEHQSNIILKLTQVLLDEELRKEGRR